MSITLLAFLIYFTGKNGINVRPILICCDKNLLASADYQLVTNRENRPYRSFFNCSIYKRNKTLVVIERNHQANYF